MSKVSIILADFMSDIEEWASEVVGTPTAQEMTDLDNIYSDTEKLLDEVYAPQILHKGKK